MNHLYTLFTFLLINQINCTTLNGEEAWVYGCSVGLAISLLGVLSALFIVWIQQCCSIEQFKLFINVLYALGCGAIIGDAIIHLLPEAFEDKNANKCIIALVFICAIVFFILMERLFSSCGITHEHWGDDLHEHTHDYGKQCDNHKLQIEQNNLVHAQIEDKQKSCLEQYKGKGSTGYLNLLSSLLHNFFDGFAIGVGFASKESNIYIPTVIAIIAHEIPREMGDVGILMKNGFTNIQTIACNGLSNITALCGLIPGLALGAINTEVQNYIMTFVAGNFVYISSDIWRHLFRNKDILSNLAQFLLFSVGVGAMFLVLLLETNQH